MHWRDADTDTGRNSHTDAARADTYASCHSHTDAARANAYSGRHSHAGWANPNTRCDSNAPSAASQSLDAYASSDRG
jgi:hypothetical protein